MQMWRINFGFFWVCILGLGCQAPQEKLKVLDQCAKTSKPVGLLVAGSGAGLPLLSALAKRYNSTNNQVMLITPASIGSGGGLKALQDGAIDVAIVTRPPAQKKEAWRIKKLATTPITFVTKHKPRDNLTRDQLVRIYKGEDDRYIPLKREVGDSGWRVIQGQDEQLAKVLMGEHLMLPTNQAMTKALLEIDGAVGWVAHGNILLENKPVYLLYPSDLKQAKWVQSIYLVYDKKHQHKLRQFLHFLAKPQTQQFMTAHGYRVGADE